MKKKQHLQKALPFLLTLALAGAATWYYDVFVHWNPKAYPFAMAAFVLTFLALAASVVWPGKAKTGLKWLCLLGWLAAFLAVAVGVSYRINNIIYNATFRGGIPAMRAVLPLVALLAAALLLLSVWRALSSKAKRSLVICAAAAVTLACIGITIWAIPANIPLKDFVPAPESPPAEMKKTLSIMDYQIIYSEPEDQDAAEILADTLQEITGLDYTAEQGAPAGGKAFLIGSVSGEGVSGLGADGYLIKPDGENIVIAGAGTRGALYGVYRFLEGYFDCRWYTDGLKVIPQSPAEIAEVKEERFVPPLFYRHTDFGVGNPGFITGQWLHGNVYDGFCHTMIREYLKPEEFFGDHPEWYCWRDDKQARCADQLCLTNPEVLAEMIREVRERIEDGNGNPVLSVSHDDNYAYCQCENCKAVDEEEGSHAGTMLRFVNAVAADIAEDYPDKFIHTFAYTYTRTPPKYARPLPNVIVQLCSIECCFAHALDDPDCPDNVPFANDIKAWSEICDTLYIWDYNLNPSCLNCVHPKFPVLQRNMQFFVEHNVKGVYEQGNYQVAECDSEFAQLRGYLLSRLLFNPGIDLEAETAGFLKAYYGGGWQYIREFIRLISSNTAKPDIFGRHRQFGLGHRPNDKALLDLKPNQVRYADRLWAQALELAGSETCKQNILRSQLSWRFWKGCNFTGEFSRLQWPGKWLAANRLLYYDFQAFGITRYSEGGNNNTWRFLPQPPRHWWDTPELWRG